MKARWCALWIVLQITSCSKLDSSAGNLEPEPLEPGMVYFNSTGKYVQMGSEAPEADVSEKPITKAYFLYDFAMGEKEVTVGEYGALMRASTTGDSAKYPVVNVSWYDAVLYCNALSKARGLDTVYVYSSKNTGTDGVTLELANLVVDYGVHGYRLPTEAEWMYAASGGNSHKYPWGNSQEGAKEYAWYVQNSQASLHKVGTKNPVHGLYDMAGNVAEWVGDVLGEYSTNAITNVVGNSFSREEQMVLKGGAYIHDLKFLRTNNRKDVYHVVKAASRPFVGFRVALGAINSIQFWDMESVDEIASTVSFVSNHAEVSSFCETKQSKMVFVDKVTGSLCYLDLSHPAPQIIRYNTKENVNHPVISPNGNWVAYSTAAEGQRISSQVFVRTLNTSQTGVLVIDSAAIPRWWVNPASLDTFLIVNSTAASNDDSLTWLQQKTEKIKFTGGKLGAREFVTHGTFNAGFNPSGTILAGGFSRLRILNHGNNSNAPNDLSGSNSPLQTAFKNGSKLELLQNGKGEDGSEQICNVSFSTTGTSRLAFLDFGYTTAKSTFTGDSYGIHEHLFISDSLGVLQSYHPVKKGYAGWNDPEWAQNSDYIVSTLSNPDGSLQNIYLYSVAKKEFLHLVSGDHVGQPHFWMAEHPVEFALDSLGLYNFPLLAYGMHEFTYKMKRYWNLRDSIEVIIAGHSRIDRGVIADSMSIIALNTASGGTRFEESIDFVNNYFIPHTPKLKVIVFSVDADFMVYSRLWVDTFIDKSYGYIYDKKNNFWKENKTDQVYSQLKAINAPDWGNVYTSRGFLPVDADNWGEAELYLDAWNQYSNYVDTVKAALEQAFAEWTQQKIHVIAIMMPQHPSFPSLGYYGKYGASIELAQQLMQEYHNLAQNNSYFHFLDENQIGKHDYVSKEFADSDHLNTTGATKFTKRLDEYIATLGLD
jgi:uncharacterized protein (TIGR02171 family)